MWNKIAIRPNFIRYLFLYTGLTVTEADDVVEDQPAVTAASTSTESAIRLAPFQPRNIIFPSKVFNMKKRSFRATWFDLYPWLEWDSKAEAAFCHTCRMAAQLRLISFAHCADDAFTNTGVSNWKHALDKFRMHDRSSAHKEAAMKWSNYISHTSISAQLLSSTAEDQKTNREALLLLFTTLRFLGRQGLSTRGHTDIRSNYHQLLQLRTNESEALRKFLTSDRKQKWLSHDVENEMLQRLSHTVLRQIADDVRRDGYYAIIVDETTDVSTVEQVSICIRHVDDDWNVSEDFVGMYATERTDAATLTKVVTDVLLRLNLSVCQLRAQCYDGASAMAGVHSGVQKRIRDVQPKAVYIHCHSHLLNLALQEASGDSVRSVRDILALVNDLGNFFRLSAKRTALLESVISDVCGSETSQSGGVTRLQPLCPTRWVVRARAFNALLVNYESVIEALDNLSDESGPAGAKAEGLSYKLRSFESLLYLAAAYKVFSVVEQLATVLQSKSMTLSGARESVSRVVASLTSMRCESQFMTLWSDVSRRAESLKLPQPEMPRRRKLPNRFDDGGPAHQYTDVISYHRAETWYAFLDIITRQIEQRFTTDSFRQICNAEDLLIRAATGKTYTNELQQFLNFYDDFDAVSLEAQLVLLHSVVIKQLQNESAVERVTVADVADVLKNTAGAQQLLDQIWRLTKLLLVVPATSATAERSFSALRRVKTYLRSTIGQSRLNSVLVLHCHQDRVDDLNIVEIAQEFVCANDSRSRTFGNFC